MNMHLQRFFGLVLAFGLGLAACAPASPAVQEPQVLQTETLAPSLPTAEPTMEPSAEPAPDSSGRTYFNQLGISLVVPEGLSVIKEPVVNLDDPSRLQSYLFYIQNYGPSEGPGEDYFQMYGLVQYDLPQTSWEEYTGGVLGSDMYAYAEEIEVNGLQGIDSQLGGQRNRFVYHFMLDGRVLSIAVSDPTEENKVLADQIIGTLQFTPGSVTETSGVVLISDPGGYYQMYLPVDWEYLYNPTAGVRLSDLQASSEDAVVIVEESEGPHDNIFYKNGIRLNVAVLNDQSALAEPAMAQVQSSTPMMIAGIEGMDYKFQEPSTAEGEIREVRFYDNGLSYLLRFSYALSADQTEIDWLIRNFQIIQ